MRKRVVILGSSGSIGESALRVIEALPGRFEVAGLAVKRDTKRLLEQAARFRVKCLAVEDEKAATAMSGDVPCGVRVLGGEAGVCEIAAMKDLDVVLCAVVGMAGLRPVMAALERGTNVALATKEVLVGAGAMVTGTCAAHGARLIPVDSEHSAIFQCLEGRHAADASRIVLTASGGPFAGRPDVNLEEVTVDQVLAHPRWRMGKKVTVDSATMMNKGLEIMEAHWLFGLPADRIDVVIHPESIVHSMVEFKDRSVLAQMSLPDMRFAIQYALTYPERVESNLPALDLARIESLHFSKPDRRRFPCLDLARAAANTGGTMPAVLNAANEVAVQKFLHGRLGFAGIWRTVERVMQRHEVVRNPRLEDVIRADEWSRKTAESIC